MRGRLLQLHLAFATSFGQIVMSLLSVWPSYTSNVFQSEATPLSTTMVKSEESMLGSLPSLGAMVGTAVAGMLIDRLGRKNGGVAMSLPFVISWTMIAVTSSIKVVLVARFLAGVAGGAFLVYAPVYISEVSEDSFRGTLASVVSVMYCLGLLISYVFGWLMTYWTIVYTNLTISVFCTFLIMTLKESPVYLMKIERFEDARDSIAYYRGCSSSSITVQREFTKLKQQLTASTKLVPSNGEGITKEDESEGVALNNYVEESIRTKKRSSLKSLFLVKSSQRAFWVVLFVMSTQVLMGLVQVQVYAESVFQQTDPERTNLYTVLFALVLSAGSLVTAIVADHVGRRILLIASSVLVCICLTILGLLLQYHFGPPWLTMLIIMVYCFMLMCGASSVPYVLLAEVFVSEVQNLASILIIEWVWFLNFLTIAIFPYMMSCMGIHGTFYSFAFVSFANAVISYFIVPETKGLSKAQIQKAFSR